jgi:hypothetical protein
MQPICGRGGGDGDGGGGHCTFLSEELAEEMEALESIFDQVGFRGCSSGSTL